MCGIVGYIGPKDAVAPIIDGLSRLEYRGYDSAGICLNIAGELTEFKKEGKLKNLENLLHTAKPKSSFGIGHTRWATHGGVNDQNAHPHINDTFAIVHNGIIENATELKADLNYNFKSETDSEVFLAVVTNEFSALGSVEKAISSAFKKVEGNSAFVIMHRETQKIYALKNSAPLVCGINESTGEMFVSSDPYALIGYTSKLYFPEDKILCVGDREKNDFSFYDLELEPSSKYKAQLETRSKDVVDKGQFEHFMMKEIFEQPRLVAGTAKRLSDPKFKEVFSKISSFKPEVINIIGCGTALHAGLVIKNFLESENSLRVVTDFASEFRYREPLLSKNDVGLFITQSGETADTLACQQHCKEAGLKTYSIVNVEGSTIYRSCDQNILLNAGAEIGVASTKAFTQMAVMGYLLSQSYADKFDSEQTVTELENAAKAIDKILSQEDEIKAIAREIYNYKGFIFTGRGNQFPIALEGALKLKEIAYVHAEGYASGELKHGPIALFDENMVNIALITSDLYKKTLSNAQEVKARKGVMVIIGENQVEEMKDISNFYFDIDYCGTTKLKPIVSNVVLQLLSYHIAKLKGTDIDKPRNLAKSVTVE